MLHLVPVSPPLVHNFPSPFFRNIIAANVCIPKLNETLGRPYRPQLPRGGILEKIGRDASVILGILLENLRYFGGIKNTLFCFGVY